MTCLRKSILEERVKDTSPVSADRNKRVLTIGNLVHQLFQQSLISNCQDGSLIKDIVTSQLEEIWASGFDDEMEVVREMEKMFSRLLKWREKFISEYPKVDRNSL